MNRYAPKKDNICLFTTDRGEQRSKGLIRGRKYQQSSETPCDVISSLLREFRGEIVSGDKMTLYSMEL